MQANNKSLGRDPGWTEWLYNATASRSVPVSRGSILDGQLPKLIIHLVVEVLAQEEWPEPKQGVHLCRLTDT